MKLPEVKKPDISKLKSEKAALDPGFKKMRDSVVEQSYENSVVFKSVMVVLVCSLVLFIWCIFSGELWSMSDYANNIFCNTISLVVVVVCLDTIVSSNRSSRKKRDEARRILRYNRLIQPDLDMYLVRKNMVITPGGKTVRKFQVNAEFTIKDMRDMYSPSELVADVGISKIKRYSHFQSILKNDFQKLIENVDFIHYPEIAEAAMKYLNATSYGEAALDAVVGYEDARAGTKSMRVMVIAMIKEEPDNGRFMDANPTMKNIYLVHQLINEQEKAIDEYLRYIRALEDSVDKNMRKKSRAEEDYE